MIMYACPPNSDVYTPERCKIRGDWKKIR